MVCAGFPRRRSAAAEGVPRFVSMTALAAAMTAVGDVARLAGVTTGNQIALVERVSVGAHGLVWLGTLRLDQADGPELDGAFAPSALGTALAPTWGGSGARGLVLPAGTIQLPGWAYLDAVRYGIDAVVAGWAFPGAPAQHDLLGAGFIRDTAAQILGGGGVGYNATPSLRSALINAGTNDLPTGTYGTNPTTGLTAGEPALVGIDASRVISTGQVTYHAGIHTAGISTSALSSAATAINAAWAAATDLQPAFCKRGDWGAARVTKVALRRNIL